MILSILVPAYNEERTIGTLLDRVKAIQLPEGYKKQIIVVNDGSTDGTPAALHAYLHDGEIQVFHQANRGKTAALLHALQYATGDVIVIQDADLEYNPEDYPRLMEPILSGQAQVVYGSRFLGQIRDMEPINLIANEISNFTMNLLYGVRITDINTCYKMFTRTAFEGLTIKGSQYDIDTEMTVKFLKKGLSIREIPISYVARSVKEGKKIQWFHALKLYWQIIKYRYRL